MYWWIDSRGRGLTAATRSDASRAEAPLHFFVGNRPSGVELSETFLDPGQEHETLDGVLVGRIGGQVPECLEDPLLRGRFRHADQLSMAIEQGEASCGIQIVEGKVPIPAEMM